MSVKFKIGFTIDGQTLFGMISKFLSVENLHVEEVVTQAPSLPKIAQRVQRAQLERPKVKRRPSKPMDLHAGINRIIIEAMSDGQPHRATEFKPLLEKGGYSPNSVGSRLQNLQEHGAVKQFGDGTWQLAPSLVQKESA